MATRELMDAVDERFTDMREDVAGALTEELRGRLPNAFRRVAIDLQQEYAVGQRSTEFTVFDMIAVLNRVAREVER